jgi:type IV pilus assembly protein PilB
MISRGEKIADILRAQQLLSQQQYEEIMKLYKSQSNARAMWSLLVKKKYVTSQQLTAILGEQISLEKKKQIGEILVDQGLITHEQLDAGLREQKRTGKRIGECLVDIGAIAREKLIDVLSAQLDVQHVVLDNMECDRDVLAAFPVELASTYTVIPLYENQGTITLAMADPTNRRVIDHIRYRTGKEIEPVIATKDSIRAAIAHYFAPAGGGIEDIDEARIDGTSQEDTAILEQVDESDHVARSEPSHMAGESAGDSSHVSGPGPADMTTALHALTARAIEAGAGSIHLAQLPSRVECVMRIDGMPHRRDGYPRDYGEALIRYIARRAGLSTQGSCVTDEGTIGLRSLGVDVSLHVHAVRADVYTPSTITALTCHLTYPSHCYRSFDEFAFDPVTREALVRVLRDTTGLLLVAGVPGQLRVDIRYALLDCVRARAETAGRIMTVEDPVRCRFDGVVHTQVDHARGYTLADAIQEARRWGADTVLADDLDCAEALASAVYAARTSRVIAEVSVCTVTEIMRMLVHAQQRSAWPLPMRTRVLVYTAIAQVCPECAQAAAPDEKMVRDFGLAPDTALYKGQGCVFCNNTGYDGTTGVYVFLDEETVSSLVDTEEGPAAQANRQAAATQRTLFTRSLVYLLQQGITSAEQARTLVERIS